MNLGRKFREYKRIIKIARKPTKKEYITTLKVTGLGVLFVGFLGFLIQSVFGLFTAV